MNRINQFQPVLYALILLGMVGYGLASGSAVMWVLGCGGVALNWWLVKTKRFKPLPRLLANVLTVATMIYVGHDLMTSAGNATVLVIGQFLVVLQLVKLWEQRGNRDFGQLLVLSLLLMVASAINTSSLLFGLLFAVYLFLSLYCCLLFHLKVESDAARAACAAPEEKVNPAALRHDEQYLSRSMRKLATVMASFSVATAVLVFLLFPRGTGQAMLLPAQLRAQYVLTGFTDEVRFDQVARITQNDNIVAYAEVWHKSATSPGEVREESTSSLLLRGVTLDTYHPNGPKGEWKRTVRDSPYEASPDTPWDRLDEHPPAAYTHQKIRLHPTGSRALFAEAGVYRFLPLRRDVRLHHGDDGSLQAEDTITTDTEYEVWSTGQPQNRASWRRPQPDSIDPSIAAYARRSDVSGSDAGGPLAARRPTDPDHLGEPNDLDEKIAENICNHLRGPAFSYTLDITDAKTRREKDPYVWFLSDDGHRGHCEYFAGAMVLMCQSLGIDARMVAGFRCDEYNNTPGADYYIVRQSHAHTWVEVRTTHGWVTFDPTSGRDTGDSASHSALGRWWKGVRHFFDFLEYTYAEKVVAYDNANRENLLNAVEEKMTSTAVQSGMRYQNWKRKWNDWWDASKISDAVAKLGGPLLAGLISAAVLVALVLAARRIWRLIQLRRRAARIGIESLPAAEQLRLAMQLAFYDNLMQLLQRHQIARPPHQTPMEFSDGLAFLPGELPQVIRRLTALYYRVRYGRAELSPGLQRHLGNVIRRVDVGLAAALPAS